MTRHFSWKVSFHKGVKYNPSKGPHLTRNESAAPSTLKHQEPVLISVQRKLMIRSSSLPPLPPFPISKPTAPSILHTPHHASPELIYPNHNPSVSAPPKPTTQSGATLPLKQTQVPKIHPITCHPLRTQLSHQPNARTATQPDRSQLPWGQSHTHSPTPLDLP